VCELQEKNNTEVMRCYLLSEDIQAQASATGRGEIFLFSKILFCGLQLSTKFRVANITNYITCFLMLEA
jgi:hypothetical protein